MYILRLGWCIDRGCWGIGLRAPVGVRAALEHIWGSCGTGNAGEKMTTPFTGGQK